MSKQIDNPIVGIDLLKMLMLQLYSNPRCIYREYIQNSLDSINEAVKLGILKRIKDGHVSIRISSNTITVEDNGTGIQSDKAVKILTDIANSIKNGIDTAGQFGVGRLSGGGYCDILEFETSYQGENIGTVVSMDTRILRRLLQENKNDISAEDAMRKICTTNIIDVNSEKHYFIVRLKNVVNSAEILLNTDEIHSYIKEVAPIDYNVTFNSLINSSEQSEFVERHKCIDKIKVSLNEIADIEKSYNITVKGSGDEIEKLRYFELPIHEKFGKMGWGWYAVTDFSVQINDDKDSNVGIRLRKHNISLDKNILNACFKEARGNKYFYGEIFITNDNIVPDSGRQGLAAGEEADALIKLIKDYFGILHLVYNKANRLKVRLKNIQDALDKLTESPDPAVRSILIGRLNTVVQDFQKCATYDNYEEVNDVISIYRNKYVQTLQKEVRKVLGEPKPVENVAYFDALGNSVHDSEIKKEIIISQTESSANFLSPPTSSSIIKKPLSASKTSSTKQLQGSLLDTNDFQSSITPSASSSLVTNKVQKKSGNSGIDELLRPLINKGLYTPDQLAVLRKVLNTMLLVCPSAKKKNILVLMQSAIASLE